MAGQIKAVHHYAVINYSKLAASFPRSPQPSFPAASERILSVSGIDESIVAIGTSLLSVRLAFNRASRAAHGTRLISTAKFRKALYYLI